MPFSIRQKELKVLFFCKDLSLETGASLSHYKQLMCRSSQFLKFLSPEV